MTALSLAMFDILTINISKSAQYSVSASRSIDIDPKYSVGVHAAILLNTLETLRCLAFDPSSATLHTSSRGPAQRPHSGMKMQDNVFQSNEKLSMEIIGSLCSSGSPRRQHYD